MKLDLPEQPKLTTEERIVRLEKRADALLFEFNKLKHILEKAIEQGDSITNLLKEVYDNNLLTNALLEKKIGVTEN